MIRKHYRALLQENVNVKETALKDKEVLREAVEQGKCLTVALYQYRRMLFLYVEAMDDGLQPVDLLPNISQQLVDWVDKEDMIKWKEMYHIYYHAVPESNEGWARHGAKKRRGRIAYLKPDKLFSYVYYHKAIVDEGLLEGDMYQSIALHEDVLFSYFEEPKIFTHIRKDVKEESKVINDWLAVNPESHFDHDLSGEENFLLIDEVVSMGVEDLE